MTSGTATGGVVFPIIAQRLLARIGIAWTMRAMGLIILLNSGIVLLLARARDMPPSSSQWIDWSAFREVWYTAFELELFLALIGLYYGYYYMSALSPSLSLIASNKLIGLWVALFAEEVAHFSRSASFSLLPVMSAMGWIGRIVPGVLPDCFVGPQNMLTALTLLSGVMIFSWIAMTSARSLGMVAVLCGTFTAGIQSTFPPALANMQKDLSQFGVGIGMMFSIIGLGFLAGTPIAGTLISRTEMKYLYAQGFAGATLSIGGLVLIIPRVSQNKQILERLFDC